MLFDRQKRLLALVDALGSEIDNLDFEQLLLLYYCEVDADPTYEFVPYKFGGFSFTSDADKRRLIEQGLLADDGPVPWSLNRFVCLTPMIHCARYLGRFLPKRDASLLNTRSHQSPVVLRESGADELSQSPIIFPSARVIFPPLA
jgi:hypothetical protein